MLVTFFLKVFILNGLDVSRFRAEYFDSRNSLLLSSSVNLSMLPTDFWFLYCVEIIFFFSFVLDFKLKLRS